MVYTPPVPESMPSPGRDPFIGQASDFPVRINRESARKSTANKIKGITETRREYEESEKIKTAYRKYTTEWWQRFREMLSMKMRAVLISRGLYADFKTLINCHRYAVPAQTKNGSKTGSPGCVVVNLYRDVDESTGQTIGRIGHAWTQKCANPLMCFLDAPRIRHERSKEIHKIVKAMYLMGYRAFFCTYTAPHNAATDPKIQIARFQEAMRRFKSDVSIDGYCYSKDIKKPLCMDHQIRAIEITDDAHLPIERRSGIHFHHHCIMFYKGNIDFDRLYTVMSNRWASCLAYEGIFDENDDQTFAKCLMYKGPRQSPCFKLDVPRINPKIERTYEEIADYIAKGAGLEISPGIFTKSAMPDRLTHFEEFVLALTSRPDLQDRMVYILRSVKGLAWLSFSKGLKQLCGIADLSDQEILKKHSEIEVTYYDPKDYEKIDDHKYQNDICRIVDHDMKEAGIDLKNIDDNGIAQIKDFVRKAASIAAAGVSPYTLESRSDEVWDKPIDVKEFVATYYIEGLSNDRFVNPQLE